MKQKGFTLVELLVVISVIGVLATLILISLNGARARSRDVRRVADLKQIQDALELYYADNGFYPRYDGSGSISCAGGWAHIGEYLSCWNDLKIQLGPYLTRLPEDPTNTVSPYQYRTHYSGEGYYLLMMPERSQTNIGKDQGCYDGNGIWYCVGKNWQ